MDKRIIITLLITCLLSGLSFGQATDATTSDSDIGVKVSYFGEFVLHPGFAAGIDYAIYQKSWFNLHWDSELGAYFHKHNSNVLFLQSSIGTRFITSFSAFVDVNAGLGYMLSSPDGDVYNVTSNNDLSEKGRPYTSHMKPIVSLLLGWDGTRKKHIPLLIHTGIEAYWQSHFNHSMLPHFALRVGVVYKLKRT